MSTMVYSGLYTVLLICVSVSVPVPYSFDYHNLCSLCSLRAGSVFPPALFCFLKTVLAIWGLLCFHTNFKRERPSANPQVIIPRVAVRSGGSGVWRIGNFRMDPRFSGEEYICTIILWR